MITHDDDWEIEKDKTSPRLFFKGEPVNLKKIKNFNFLEKDFRSTIPEKDPAQFLHRRFLVLLNVLKNSLSDSFNQDKCGTGMPNLRSGGWTPNQWLWFSRKGAFIEDPKDSLTFQVTVSKDSGQELTIDIWLTNEAQESKQYLSKKITENKESFKKLLGDLPQSYYIGINVKGAEKQEKQISLIDDKFIEHIAQELQKKKSRFFIKRYFTKKEAIQYGVEIPDEISNTFEKLIPISEFLNKSIPNAAEKAHSCFILTQYIDSKYDDVEGEQYQYDNQKPNSRKLIEGSKFIIQSKINNENCFVGYGKINSISESSDTNEKGKPITKFVAKFSEYTKIDPPKIRTEEIYSEIKSQKAYGSQPPSILPITRQLYKKITGQDLGEDEEEITGMKTDYSRTVNILRRKKNIILYGPPGTGKTYTAKKIAEIITNQSNSSNSRHTWNTVTTLVLIENSGKPLNYHEIAKKAIEKNLVITKGQTPEETIAKNMRNDIEKLGNNSFFKKTEEAIYGLNVPTTFAKAAEMILFAYNKPMKTTEIAKIAQDKHLINTIGETPERTMTTEFIRDIENNGENSTFVKVDEGTYGLRKQNPHSNNDEQFIENVTFHQSYGYEEFIEGIRPTPTNNGITYTVEPGLFQEFCKKANKNQGQDYVIIIDEVNRGNISKIFGELITIIEKDKRGVPVTLAYSKKSFSVPENIFVIGTMNTADQSLTHMDAALKRRFSLVEIMPNPSLLKPTKSGILLGPLLEKLNDRIIANGSRDNQIGHSYFMDDGKSIDSTEDLQFVFATDIIPLLRDYFYDDENSLKEILGEKFIDWDNPHRDMIEDWQDEDHPEIFLKTLRDAFGNQIVSN